MAGLFDKLAVAAGSARSPGGSPAPYPFRMGARMKHSAPGGAHTDHAPSGVPSRPRAQALPATFTLDRSGRIVTWSTAAEALFGCAAREAIGRSCLFLFPKDDQGSAQEWLSRAQSRAEDSEPHSAVLPVLCAGGESLPKVLGCTPLIGADGRTGLLCQVTDLLQQATRGEAQAAFVEAVMQGSPFGLGMLDNELRYVMVNRALAELNDLPAEAHVGRRVTEVVRTEDGGAYEQRLRQVLTTGEPLHNLLITGRTAGRPDRERVWAVSYFRLAPAEDRILGLGGIVVDVTRKQAPLLEASRVRQRLTLVNEASRRIGTTLEIPRTARELTEVAVPAFADAASVELRRDLFSDLKVPLPGASVRTDRIACRSVLGTSVMERLSAVRPDEEILHPVGSRSHEAMRTVSAVLVEELDEAAVAELAYSPEHARALRESGLGSLVMVPLTARGRLLGIACFGRSAAREPMNGEDLKVAEELAARAAVCLDNALMYSSERRIAVELQRSMLPGDDDIPRRPGLEVARHYRPSSSSAQVGGDWFDVIPLSGHRVALVIGDMMGHDITAAANMGQLRTAMRTLARLDLEPATLLSRLDGIVQRDAAIPYATCVYAVYDTVTRKCSVASAGHPAPVLRRSDGTTELISLDPGVPLGVSFGAPEFHVTDLDLPDDSTLVLYTDGLIERRGEDIDAGIEALREALGSRAPSVQELCDGTVARLRASTDEDDLAVLMARVPAMPDHRSAEWTLPSAPRSAARARAAVREALREWDLAAHEDTTVLLVSELVTNALLHCRGEIELRLAKGMTLLVEVADADERTPRRCNADADDERGRGLALVGELAADWGTRRTSTGKIVWCEVASLEATAESWRGAE